MRTLAFLPSFLFLPFCAALPAQVVLGTGILGIERGAVTKLDTIAPTTCARAAQCNLPSPPLDAHPIPLGGLAWDANVGRVYSSDGRDWVLTKLDCAEVCRSTIPATMPGITGVGYNKFRKLLYSSHTDNRIRIWPGGSCPTSTLGECPVNVVNTQTEVITGIEFDDRVAPEYPNGRLFVVSNAGRLYVLREPLPGACAEICHATLPACAPAFTTWQGLTYDPARRRVYVTDGKRLLVVKESGDCTLALVSCCTIGTVDSELSGLAWKSGIPPSVVGVPCTDPRCLGCMIDLGSSGWPSAKSGDFALTLGSLPVNGTAVAILSFGPPAAFPYACGKVHVDPTSPLWIVLPAQAQGGTTSCSAKATIGMGFFPVVVSGYEFTVQAAAVCGGGLALSHGLTFVIGS